MGRWRPHDPDAHGLRRYVTICERVERPRGLVHLSVQLPFIHSWPPSKDVCIDIDPIVSLCAVEIPKPLYAIISSMFDQSKKSTITCAQLIQKLNNMSPGTPPDGQTIILSAGKA